MVAVIDSTQDVLLLVFPSFKLYFQRKSSSLSIFFSSFFGYHIILAKFIYAYLLEFHLFIWCKLVIGHDRNNNVESFSFTTMSDSPVHLLSLKVMRLSVSLSSSHPAPLKPCFPAPVSLKCLGPILLFVPLFFRTLYRFHNISPRQNSPPRSSQDSSRPHKRNRALDPSLFLWFHPTRRNLFELSLRQQ